LPTIAFSDGGLFIKNTSIFLMNFED
jgi:hypothetical protein